MNQHTLDTMRANAEALVALLHETDFSPLTLDALGFKYIGRGDFKEVYGSREYGLVVKHIIYVSDWSGGALEVSNYEDAPAHVKPHLLPILACTDNLQVQKYLHEGNSYQCWSDKTCIAATLGRDITGGQHVEGRNHYHRLDGTIAIYDYGLRDQWDNVKAVA